MSMRWKGCIEGAGAIDPHHVMPAWLFIRRSQEALNVAVEREDEVTAEFWRKQSEMCRELVKELGMGESIIACFCTARDSKDRPLCRPLVDGGIYNCGGMYMKWAEEI